MTSPRLLTLSKIAIETGCDRRTAKRHLVDAGVAAIGKSYPAAAAIQAVVDRLDPARELGHMLAARGAPAPVTLGPLALAKAEAEQQRTEKLRLDVAERKGQLLPRDAVQNAAADLIVRARTAFLGLGPRVAPVLVGLGDQHQIAAVIETETRKILADLASIERLVDEALGL